MSDARALVIVEGVSDKVALEALAERRGRNLDAEGISVVPIGGAQGIGRFLEQLSAAERNVRLAGLCDAGEERDFRRGLERAGWSWVALAPPWSDSASTCAWRIWRTS
jgi:hypothetical protein